MRSYSKYQYLRDILVILNETKKPIDKVTRDEIRYVTNELDESHRLGLTPQDAK